MSSIVLDHTQDVSGQDIHRLTSLFPPPAFVKQADHAKLCGDPETLPRHVYADPENQLYPCHTAAATWMSAAFYFDKQASVAPHKRERVEAGIKHAAQFFGISGLIEELGQRVKVASENELTKLSNDEFAIVWGNPDGSVERHWPLRNGTEVSFATAHFAKHRDQFDFSDRYKIANRLLDKALEFGADLEGHDVLLTQAAGRGACSARDAADLFDKRALLMKGANPDISAEFAKTAQIIRANPASARGYDKLIKFAEIISNADVICRLTSDYEHGLDRPEEVLFRVTEKAAHEFVAANVEMITGNVYALNDLEKVSAVVLREWMGDEFTAAVTAGDVFVDGAKLAMILPTLDRGQATQFERCLSEQQVRPVMVQKAAVDNLLGRERLIELANQHQLAGFIQI